MAQHALCGNARSGRSRRSQTRAALSLAGLLALGACASMSPPPAPDPARGPVMAWKCSSGSTFSAQWTAGANMEVIAGGQMYWLPARKAGSTVHYTNKKVEFSEKGGVATLNGAAGGPYTKCTL